MKKIFLLSLLLFAGQFTFASQLKGDTLKYQKQHYLSLGYSSLFFIPLQTNSSILRSRFSHSPELNVGYTFDFNKFFSLNSRLNFSKNSFRYNYQFETPLNSVYQQADSPIERVKSTVYENELGYNLNLDLVLNVKIPQKENFFSIGFGPRAYTFFRNYIYLLYTDNYYINAQNRNQSLFRGVLNNDKYSTFNFSTNAYLSYNKRLKKGLFVKMSLIHSHSYFKRLDGSYQFSGIGNDDPGYWFQKISFIGASIELMIPTRVSRPGRRF